MSMNRAFQTVALLVAALPILAQAPPQMLGAPMELRWSAAALSPDGKQLAVLETSTISLLDLATRKSTLLLRGGAGLGLTFAADGQSLYFLGHDTSHGSITVLNRYSFVTGKSTKLLTGLDNAVASSPDSKHIAFIRMDQPHECALMIADADGRGERQLASVVAESCRAWFPEQERAVVEIIGVGLDRQGQRQLVMVSTRTGEKKELPVQKGVMKMIWPNAAAGLFILRPQPWRGWGLIYGEVWHRDTPDAGGRQMTREPEEVKDIVGASADGSILALTRPVFAPISFEGTIGAIGSLFSPRPFAYPREVVGYELIVLKVRP
jgi:hypothetical protein